MQNYLIHWGTLGQKWGKRNYQYEDGSLTPEGRIHYGVGPPRSSIKSSHGALKRYKYAMNDHVVKAGKRLQHITLDEDIDKLDTLGHFYAASSPADKIRYAGDYAWTLLEVAGFDEIYNETRSVKRDLKIAGGKSAEGAFLECFKNNKAFREAAKSLNCKSFASFVNRGFREKNLIKNRGIDSRTVDKTRLMTSLFKEELSKSGYDGCIDLYDALIGDWHADIPVVIFKSASDSLGDRKVRRMTDLEIHQKEKIALGMKYVDGILKQENRDIRKIGI